MRTQWGAFSIPRIITNGETDRKRNCDTMKNVLNPHPSSDNRPEWEKHGIVHLFPRRGTIESRIKGLSNMINDKSMQTHPNLINSLKEERARLILQQRGVDLED